jgi:hypothetical protein
MNLLKTLLEIRRATTPDELDAIFTEMNVDIFWTSSTDRLVALNALSRRVDEIPTTPLPEHLDQQTSGKQNGN